MINRLSSLLVVLLVVATACQAKVASTDQASVSIVRVQDDPLPAFADELSEVEEGSAISSDALLISVDLLQAAKTDAGLKAWLQETAFKAVLLVYGGDTKQVAEILELKSPTMTTTTTHYVVAALRATPKNVVGGGVLFPNDSNTEVLLNDLKDYVLLVQQQVGK
jgi:hypothetical protein